MSASFRIGEMARLVPCRNANYPPLVTDLTAYFETLVTVDSAPILDDGFVDGVGYRIIVHTGKRFYVGAVCLVRQPPAQDWKELCNLTDAPNETELA